MTSTHATGTTVETTVETTEYLPPAGRYAIDIYGSSVAFSGRHMFGLLPVRGAFAIKGGVIMVADPVTESSVHAELNAGSFHTGDAHRDGDVRSARFLDTGRYPTIEFQSTRLDPGADGADATLTGTLTVRGTGRPVSLVVQRWAAQPGSPNSLTVHASARIDRTAFGVTAARGLAGRYLDVSLEIKAVRR